MVAKGQKSITKRQDPALVVAGALMTKKQKRERNETRMKEGGSRITTRGKVQWRLACGNAMGN